MNPAESVRSPRNPLPWRFVIVAACLVSPLLFLTATAAKHFLKPPAEAAPEITFRTEPPPVVAGDLPADFEQHEAMLICWSGGTGTVSDPKVAAHFENENQTLIECIREVHQRIRVVALVSSNARRRIFVSRLKEAGIPESAIQIVQVPFETCWIRDFGPFSMRNATQNMWITPERFSCDEERPVDWTMSEHLTARLNVPHKRIRLSLDGGNLLSNGKGLLITSRQTLEDNRVLFGYSREDVDKLLRLHFGAKQIVYLESLHQERTRHVDMFATFTAHDTIVLGEYPPEVDFPNYTILERNRQQLESIIVDGRPLKVSRIPMPPRGNRIFGGSYTNVVFANGRLLVPVFGDIDPAGHAKAVDVYRNLLPNWEIVPVDSNAWIVKGGSLHCLTKNVHRLSPRPAPLQRGPQQITGPVSQR